MLHMFPTKHLVLWWMRLLLMQDNYHCMHNLDARTNRRPQRPSKCCSRHHLIYTVCHDALRQSSKALAYVDEQEFAEFSRVQADGECTKS